MGWPPSLPRGPAWPGPLRRWGWPGAVGLLSLFAAGLAWLVWLPGLAQERQVLHEAVVLAQQRGPSALAVRPAAVPPVTPRQRFREGLPAAATRHARVSALLAAARKHGLNPTTVELRLSDDATLDLARYSLTTPLRGSYAALRAFVEDVQAHDPGLSLDRLRLSRATVAEAVVTAELEWSLYMRSDASLLAAASTAKAEPR